MDGNSHHGLGMRCRCGDNLTCYKTMHGQSHFNKLNFYTLFNYIVILSWALYDLGDGKGSDSHPISSMIYHLDQKSFPQKFQGCWEYLYIWVVVESQSNQRAQLYKRQKYLPGCLSILIPHNLYF